MRHLVFALVLILPLGAKAIELEGADKVSPAVAGFIEEILTAAGLESASISRGSTTPARQAEIMYDYYLKQGAPNCKAGKVVHAHTCACGSYGERLACGKATYGPIGDAAIESINDPADRSAAIAEMTGTIEQLIDVAGNNRNEMAHVPIPGRFAVDVRPSSISNKESFKAAVIEHPMVIKERFFYPGKSGGPGESAFHLEFKVD